MLNIFIPFLLKCCVKVLCCLLLQSLLVFFQSGSWVWSGSDLFSVSIISCILSKVSLCLSKKSFTFSIEFSVNLHSWYMRIVPSNLSQQNGIFLFFRMSVKKVYIFLFLKILTGISFKSIISTLSIFNLIFKCQCRICLLFFSLKSGLAHLSGLF